jgi:hypothetical protein
MHNKDIRVTLLIAATMFAAERPIPPRRSAAVRLPQEQVKAPTEA